MDWLDGLQQLRRQRVSSVLVTLASVKGHAPRNGGAKMVVTAEATIGTIGGGSLEATGIQKARDLLASGAADTELLTIALSDKASSSYGVQCCGGEVTMLLEPVRAVASVAIFGVGHVGLELARILSRHELDLHLIDSRPEMLDAQRLAPLSDAVARIHIHSAPAPVPEAVLEELPPGTHVLVMTHDHAEDLAIIDHALGMSDAGSIGLIGSSAKWVRFTKALRENGRGDAALARVETPIGVPEVTGKQPASIAVSVAARLLQRIEEAAAQK